jgi:hypothetical protein
MVTQAQKTQQEILSEASTLSSIRINTQKVSKNVLNKYATYNYLFTLSGVSTDEVQNCSYMRQAPHDIVARSSGIGTADNGIDFLDDDFGLATKTVETLSARGIEALSRDRQILEQNRDLYFQSVEIDSVHGMNPERGTAPVTKIRMKIVEPAGVSLFNKLRAAAANNGFRDHLSAPFLLTITFKGFDDLGKTLTDDKEAVTRHIPIKIFKCDLRVNQGGTEYEVQAIPHNEFGYMDRFLYTRTNISLTQKSTIWSYMQNLQNALNYQLKDEADQQLCEEGKQDEYQIVLHPDLGKQTMEPVYKGKNNTKEIPMEDRTIELSEGAEISGAIGYDAKGGQIPKGTSILKIIEQAMKSLPVYRDLVDKWFDRTIKATTNKSGKKLFTAKDVASYLDSDPSQYFVDWFRVKSSIEVLPEFDNITKQQRKKITLYVYPYRIHVYRLAVPGVSLGGVGSYNARKIYDYLFTGNNTEVLDLDIEYKYAYYQTALKDVDANYMSASNIDLNTSLPGTFKQTGSQNDTVEPLLPYQQYVGTASSVSTGATVQTYKLVDVFMDQLTNPQADMVQIRMDIMGDPAWIPQTQFMPVRAYDTIAEDQNIKEFKNADGTDVGWNTRFSNFNTDTADPVILINFKMPTDLNDRTGLYKLQDESNGMFSGLYQVYKTTHNFDNGQFRQTLHCVRFNNQSNERQRSAIKTEYALGPDGNILSSKTKATTATEGSS